MAVETLKFQQPRQADTTTKPSESVWADCPLAGLRDRSVAGSIFFDDFVSFVKTPATTEGNWAAGNGYAQFSSTGGTIVNPDTTGQGGAIKIGSDDDNEGVSLRTLATPFRIDRSTKNFWCELRFKVSTIADAKADVFVGLMEDAALTATVPITAAGALADQNLFGFFRPETARTVAGTGGAVMNTVYKANGVTAVTVQSDAVALVADTYTKLGIKFNAAIDPFNSGVGDGYGRYLLSFFQDGQLLSTQYQVVAAQGTDFPNDVTMGLVFAILNAAGSSPCTATMDWWQAAQVF